MASTVVLCTKGLHLDNEYWAQRRSVNFIHAVVAVLLATATVSDVFDNLCQDAESTLDLIFVRMPVDDAWTSDTESTGPFPNSVGPALALRRPSGRV